MMHGYFDSSGGETCVRHHLDVGVVFQTGICHVSDRPLGMLPRVQSRSTWSCACQERGEWREERREKRNEAGRWMKNSLKAFGSRLV